MPFMTPKYDHGGYYAVETTHGTECVPASLVGLHATIEDLIDYTEGNPHEDQDIEFKAGVGVRLSAPGYMDCTDWSFFATEDEAREYVKDTYEVDPDSGEDLTGDDETGDNQ
jgi:hypothetical protein